MKLNLFCKGVQIIKGLKSTIILIFEMFEYYTSKTNDTEIIVDNEKLITFIDFIHIMK